MYYAVEGCAHGSLDQIYMGIRQLESHREIKIELLLICGDFQATRNADDLNCMAVPDKYRRMGDFPDYYSGKKTAPCLTIFVGGNHEASNHMWELYYGGWVAPNIYFLGFSGCVWYGGLRICGLSGIYKHGHHQMSYAERVPYSRDSERSIYHVRAFEVNRLARLSGHVDICLSHDWPVGITKHGDEEGLISAKEYFADDIAQNRLGNPLTFPLLQSMKPSYWFAGHLHIKFAAVVKHAGVGSSTKFLALSKPTPRDDFLQVLYAPTARGPRVLEYDAQWLGIVRLTHGALPRAPHQPFKFTPSDLARETAWVKERMASMAVPHNFVADLPAGSVGSRGQSPRHLSMDNNQTAQLLHTLQLATNPFIRGGHCPSATQETENVLSGAAKKMDELQGRLDQILTCPLAPVPSGASARVAPACCDESSSSDDGEGGAVFACSCAGECTCNK